VIRDGAESGRPLRFASLLGELADPAAKRLASDLYTLGEDLLTAAQSQAAMAGQRRTASEEVVVSWRDLENLERRDRFRNASDQRDEARDSTPRDLSGKSLHPSDAVERLARARERGHDATAVSSLFGRRSSAADPGDSGRSSTS